ncbi:ABC transporter substrate-binding protein [Nodosilinea sp. LEGE 07298]|uniref:ABC transporter substrate-binding protein n=1 Tax=Nodosilinea sp. LEGE 07298 TaxID=2777970 RepID=UPI001880CD7E|nr:ABC transporter substrate-binding protein [Nodosilinea sp. LEGE 07298]MBE9111870.1 ABC transporter substrate-binding protein [Nodosilinea sp. LEGE 07298]
MKLPLLLPLILLPLAACSSQADPVRAGSAEATENRIVSLTSLSADLVQTLDDDALVGIPGNALLRDDARFEGLPAVSEGRTEPDLEQIVALEPTLVIGAAGFHDRTLQRLEELGTPTLTTEVNSWADLRALTESLAATVEANPKPLLDRYNACLAEAPDTSLTTLVLVSRQPLLAPNKTSWAGDFLAQFNIENVAADLQGESPFEGYITLPEEKVLDTNPEALLIVDAGEDLLNQLKGEPFWSQLKATQQNQVHSFDYFGLVNPGSLASIEQTCHQLGNLFE